MSYACLAFRVSPKNLVAIAQEAGKEVRLYFHLKAWNLHIYMLFFYMHFNMLFLQQLMIMEIQSSMC